MATLIRINILMGVTDMGRLFSVLFLLILLLGVSVRVSEPAAQPVFFSMLFPQLVPPELLEATAGEAVFL